MSLSELPLIVQVHLYTGTLSLLLGPLLHLQKNKRWLGTPTGKTWVGVTALSCLSSFGIGGPVDGGGSVLHLVALFILGAMGIAQYFYKKGRFDRHQRVLVGAYFGVLFSFVYSLRPGRFLGQIWEIFLSH